MSVLEIHNLEVKFSFKKRTITAVQDINIKVKAGQIVGIIGESGAGKSTIGKAIIALLDRSGFISYGSIKFQGQDITHMQYAQAVQIRGKQIATIFQDPLSSLNPVLKIRSQMCESIKANLQLTNKAAYEKALELLERLEIADPKSSIEKYPHQLSGGQRQRVIIAIALAANPKLIIADEATSALDASLKMGILQRLKKLCQEENIALLLITHDMQVMATMADYLYIMKSGKIIEQGQTQKILDNASMPYSKALIAAVPPLNIKLHRFAVLDTKHNQQNQKSSEQAAIDFLKSDLNNKSTQNNNAEAIIKVQNLSKYFGKKASLLRSSTVLKAVDQVSFELRQAKTLGLVGESGSGKSTLGLMVAGLMPMSSGTVKYKGVCINDKSDKAQVLQRRLASQVIFQAPFASLNRRMSIGTLLSEALKVHRIVKDKDKLHQIVLGLLHIVGLKSDDYYRYAHQFSGGEQQRIAIARALSVRPRFIFADEPSSALDLCTQAQILNLLKDLQEQLGLTMLFVSHDLAVIRQMSDEVAVMQQGKICEIGKVEQVFNQPQHQYTKSLLKAASKVIF